MDKFTRISLEYKVDHFEKVHTFYLLFIRALENITSVSRDLVEI